MLRVAKNVDDGKLVEILIWMGKSGGCEGAGMEALGRVMSLALQNDVPVNDIIEHLQGITCCVSWGEGDDKNLSPADALAKNLKSSISPNSVNELEEMVEKQFTATNDRGYHKPCPECGGPLLKSENCFKCISCGYSKC